MNPEKERPEQKIDWREEFEREAIRRSGVSDEEAVRQQSAPYEPPAFEVQEARERDEHMVTTRELFDLYRLHSMVVNDPTKAAPALRPYYEELLERVWQKLEWAVGQIRKEGKEAAPFFDRGLEDFTRKVGELLWQQAEAPRQSRDFSRLMMFLDEFIRSIHINGPLARYFVRDMHNFHDAEIKDFFDRLREY